MLSSLNVLCSARREFTSWINEQIQVDFNKDPEWTDEGMVYMNILVTGGAGFIGSNLVRHLLSSTEDNVINLDKLTYAGNLKSLSSVNGDSRHVFTKGDIGDGDLVSELLKRHRLQAVINLAAETHVDRSIDDPSKFIRTNMDGTFVLLESVLSYWKDLTKTERRNFRFIHVSTDEVYGTLEEGEYFREDSPYAPRSPYSASKASSDHLVMAYHATYGLPAIVTHSSNNYGPFQFPEKLIPLMIQKALRSENLPLYGDGGNTRDWLYVEDHCRALVTVLRKASPGETFNIGGNCQKSNLEVVKKICGILNKLQPVHGVEDFNELVSFVPDRPGHDGRYAIDTTKIRKQLGWQPGEIFDRGLEKTIRWYLDNQAWVHEVTCEKYRMERLGLEKETLR